MSHSNSAGKNAVRMVNFYPYLYPAGSPQATEHERVILPNNYVSVVYTAEGPDGMPAEPSMFVHDEVTPGGHLVGGPGPEGPEGPMGATGPEGPEGPTAVSADAGSASTLGSDGLVFTPSAAAQLPAFEPIYGNDGTTVLFYAPLTQPQ